MNPFFPCAVLLRLCLILIQVMAPDKFEWNFRYIIFENILVIDSWGILCEIALIWMSVDFTDDQSTLVQVMAWCRQPTSHYLSQYSPRSLSPYGVTRPQSVNNIFRFVVVVLRQLHDAPSTVNSPTPLVPHICVSESVQHWFRWWLVAYPAPSHYLKQCWFIVNWTLRNKLHWNFN